MTYWIELQISNDDIVADQQEQVTDNWIKDNHPMLLDLPEGKVNCSQNESTLYLSQLKISQDEAGCYVLDQGEMREINSGDEIVVNGVRARVSITKMQQTRRSLMPNDLIESSLPILSQDSAPFSYSDLKPVAEKKSYESPIDGVNELFSDYFDKPFSTHVPLHQQVSSERMEQASTLTKLKQLVWGNRDG